MRRRIAHITDTHLDDRTALDRGIDPRKNLVEVLEHIAANNIDEIVFTGDIGNPGTSQWLFDKLNDYKPGAKVILGNHDDLQEALQHYRSTTTAGKDGLYYAYEDDPYKYIFLDSSSTFISPAQLQWLESEAATIKKIILYIHHPILGFPTGMDKTYPLQNRDEVISILQQCKHPVTVFCGHYHMPDKRTEGKITQYITPGISFQVKKNSPTIEINVATFGYRIITLTDNDIKSSLVISCYDYFSPKEV